MAIELIALIAVIVAGVIATKIFIISVILAALLIFWLRRGGFILLLLLFSSLNPTLGLLLGNLVISKFLITGKALRITEILVGNITRRLIIGRRIDKYIQKLLLFLNFYVFKKLIPPPMNNKFWDEITPKQREFLQHFPWEEIRKLFNNISTRNILYDKDVFKPTNFYIDTHKYNKKFNLKNLFIHKNNFDEDFYYDEKDDNYIFYSNRTQTIIPNIEEKIIIEENGIEKIIYRKQNSDNIDENKHIKYSDNIDENKHIKYSDNIDENKHIKYSDNIDENKHIKYSDNIDENKHIKYSDNIDENKHNHLFKKHKKNYDKNCKRLCDLEGENINFFSSDLDW